MRTSRTKRLGAHLGLQQDKMDSGYLVPSKKYAKTPLKDYCFL